MIKEHSIKIFMYVQTFCPYQRIQELIPEFTSKYLHKF